MSDWQGRSREPADGLRTPRGKLTKNISQEQARLERLEQEQPSEAREEQDDANS